MILRVAGCVALLSCEAIKVPLTAFVTNGVRGEGGPVSISPSDNLDNKDWVDDDRDLMHGIFTRLHIESPFAALFHTNSAPVSAPLQRDGQEFLGLLAISQYRLHLCSLRRSGRTPPPIYRLVPAVRCLFPLVILGPRRLQYLIRVH